MATATQQKTRHHAFPRKLGRFINLEGGLYGTLDLVAITGDVLEFQTGEDFIRFDREQATNLRDTIDKFLAFERREPRGEGREVAEIEQVEVEAVEQTENAEAVAAVEEQVVRRPRRHRRRKSA